MDEAIDWKDVRCYLLEGEREEIASLYKLDPKTLYNILHGKTRHLTRKNMPVIQELVSRYKKRKAKVLAGSL